MDRVSKGAVSEGDATPSAIFQDAVEHQVSSSELSYAMDSYLQTRDIEVKEKPQMKMILMTQRSLFKQLKWIVGVGK